uniref:DUF927 domain-containing protein n=2 Tax=Rubinisphaera brasiliensis TaxID=119 RepID=F0SKR6_RUBBR|nr:hypothetical protein Plabr_1119 [Rubinisphaera brasiliensis DSM 5305]
MPMAVRKMTNDDDIDSQTLRVFDDVEGVEAVEREEKALFEWEVEAGHAYNFESLGKLLSSLPLGLYRHRDGGLLLDDNGTATRITTAKQLTPLLVDAVRMTVIKEGKHKGEHPSDSILNTMLASRSFLDNFEEAAHVATTPVVLKDGSPAAPGWNAGGVLYLGSRTATADLDCIPRFLDVMPFDSEASRTNAVAALLTVPFRLQFPGGKPLVLVSATKSHSGKGTLIEFVKGQCPKAEILYESTDWPMQRQLHEQLLQTPEIGVLSFDNVRTDSAGKAKIIRSAFLEGFVTNAEIVLSSAISRNRPLRTANTFVVMLNTNEGSLSPDLLNRSLPIRLTPTGDLQERVARTKAILGGDIKHEWIPQNRKRIESEMLGMIERWVKEGKPHDHDVRHPMGPWAATIGGILKVNGFDEFLANYGSTRATADPVREALSILAFRSGGKPMRARQLSQLAVREGLHKTLMPGVEHTNVSACERAIGVSISPYVGETVMVSTPIEAITYRLTKQQGRFGESHPHFRYLFNEESRQTLTEEPGGLVLEERRCGSLDVGAIEAVLEQDIETLTEEKS